MTTTSDRLMDSPFPALGKYQLHRRVGVGGMAEVYEARLHGPSGFSKRVALKVLLPHFQRDPEVVRAFIDEATIAAELSHPNIVLVHDFGQVEQTYYLAMELVDGWDLREMIQRFRSAERLMPVSAAAYVAHQLAQALAHVHRHARKIVHRDVSPQNLFITRDGHVKLGDFGIAKAASRLARTEDGVIKGKLAYLAPEQLRGDPVSGRADVYAAGLLLFELLTLSRYNPGRCDVDLLSHAMNPTPRRPSALAPQAAPLDGIVAAALQPHPAMRTARASLLAEELGAFLADQPWDASAMAQLVHELEDGLANTPAPPTERDPWPPLGDEQPVDGGGQPHLDPPGMAPTGTLALPGGTAQPARRGITRLHLGLVVGLVGVVGLLVLLVLAVRTDAPPNSELRPEESRFSKSAAMASVAVPDAGVPEVAQREASDGGAPTQATRRRAVRGERRNYRGLRTRRPRSRTVASKGGSAAPLSKTKQGRANNRRGTERALRKRRSDRVLQLLRDARQRGVWPGDDREFDRRLAQTRRAIAQGEGDAELGELALFIGGFRPDEPFIKRKLKRLERRIAGASLDDEQRNRWTLALQHVLNLALDDRLTEASRRISEMLRSLPR